MQRVNHYNRRRSHGRPSPVHRQTGAHEPMRSRQGPGKSGDPTGSTRDRRETHRCIGTVIYLYDHSTRQLPKHLIEASQDGRDLSRTTPT